MSIPLEWLGTRHQAVLVTLRADGSPQTSNIAFALVEGVMKVSVTDTRAKTHNLRRDPRGVLHVLGEHFYQYASVAVTAELTELTAVPGDAVGRELLATYEAITGAPHPDPSEFLQAMVDDQRLVVRLTPVSAAVMGVD